MRPLMSEVGWGAQDKLRNMHAQIPIAGTGGNFVASGNGVSFARHGNLVWAEGLGAATSVFGCVKGAS